MIWFHTFTWEGEELACMLMLRICYSLTCGLSLSQTFQGVTLLGRMPLKKLKARISFNINSRSSMGRATQRVMNHFNYDLKGFVLSSVHKINRPPRCIPACSDHNLLSKSSNLRSDPDKIPNGVLTRSNIFAARSISALTAILFGCCPPEPKSDHLILWMFCC